MIDRMLNVCPSEGTQRPVVLDVANARRLSVLDHPPQDALTALEVDRAILFAGPGARAREQRGARGVEEADRGVVRVEQLERRVGHRLEELLEGTVVRELSRQLQEDVERALGAEKHEERASVPGRQCRRQWKSRLILSIEGRSASRRSSRSAMTYTTL